MIRLKRMNKIYFKYLINYWKLISKIQYYKLHLDICWIRQMYSWLYYIRINYVFIQFRVIQLLFIITTDATFFNWIFVSLIFVFSLVATSGVTDHGTSYNILLIYELEFSHKAVNMLIGPLGQTTKGKGKKNFLKIFWFLIDNFVFFKNNKNKAKILSVYKI